MPLKKPAILAGIFLLTWLGLRTLLPLLLPFLVGGALALTAEPAVRRLSRRLPRPVAAGIGVSAALLLLLTVVSLLVSALLRQLGALAGALPDLEQAARQGLDSAQSLLLRASRNAPGAVRPLLERGITRLMGDSTAIFDRAAARLPQLATGLASRVPGSALTAGTAVISGFMISARLPRITARVKGLPTAQRLRALAPALKRTRGALWGWLKAQAKLWAVSFLLVTGGLFLLRVAHAPLWGLLTALVDAVPVLGTGTVLLPWALLCGLQGQYARSLGLLGIYVAALIARSVLEPRLVGRQLGLDPLLTLMAMYAGFRLWGFGGMLLAPLLCVAAAEILKATRSPS